MVEIYEGPCSYEAAAEYAGKCLAAGCDEVVGIGGGRIMDFSKAVAEYARLGTVNIPTSISTCAAFTTMSVMYTPEGAKKDCWRFEHEIDAVLVDMEVIARCPVRYAAAGILDAMAKRIEIQNGKPVMRLEENKFDALLTDIQMPAMNGFDLLDAIRALPAVRAKTIPVIAITARSDMDAEYFRSKGFAGCLHKPFNTHEIFEVLSQAIRQDLTDLEETGTEILQAPTNDSSHTDSSSLDFSALTAFSEDDPNAAKEIIRTFVSETKKNRSCMATALENEEIEGITAMAHKLLPLFTMLGANTSIAPLTWLEQRRGTTEMTSEIREKALFILDEIDRVIRQAEEQI